MSHDKVELKVARIVIISLIVRFGRFSGFVTLYSTTSDYFLILAKVLNKQKALKFH